MLWCLLFYALIDNVRVIGGRGPYEGRLEVFYHGEWGTVCNDYFDITDAHVACRQLGYRGATRLYYFGQGSGEIWLDDVVCNGTETSLHNCSYSDIGDHNCGHADDVGVVCQGMIIRLHLHCWVALRPVHNMLGLTFLFIK